MKMKKLLPCLAPMMVVLIVFNSSVAHAECAAPSIAASASKDLHS